MALTTKKRRFAESKVGGATNKEAAIAAGYAASSASAAGSRLIKDPDVVESIEKLKAKLDVKGAPRNGDSMPGDSPDPSLLEPGGDFLDSIPYTEDPLTWLLALMNEPQAKVFDRRNAAQKAVDFIHSKKSDAGKKAAKNEAAKQVAGGKFAAAKAPGHLRSVK